MYVQDRDTKILLTYGRKGDVFSVYLFAVCVVFDLGPGID